MQEYLDSARAHVREVGSGDDGLPVDREKCLAHIGDLVAPVSGTGASA
jgi:hypothetical protein